MLVKLTEKTIFSSKHKVRDVGGTRRWEIENSHIDWELPVGVPPPISTNRNLVWLFLQGFGLMSIVVNDVSAGEHALDSRSDAIPGVPGAKSTAAITETSVSLV